MIMLLVCTLLSGPAYALFLGGSLQSNYTKALILNDFPMALSLGNLGEKTSNANKIDFRQEKQQVLMLCKAGVIVKVNKYGIALVDSQNQESYNSTTFCNVNITANNSLIN